MGLMDSEIEELRTYANKYEEEIADEINNELKNKGGR